MALVELRARVQQAGRVIDEKLTREEVEQALAGTKVLCEQAKAQLGLEVAAGQEAKFARDAVEGARRAAEAVADKSCPAALRQENATLRTQVAFYDKRDKLRGLDHPPCWTDSESKIEFIFNVQTTQGGFVVTRGTVTRGTHPHLKWSTASMLEGISRPPTAPLSARQDCLRELSVCVQYMNSRQVASERCLD